MFFKVQQQRQNAKHSWHWWLLPSPCWPFAAAAAAASRVVNKAVHFWWRYRLLWLWYSERHWQQRSKLHCMLLGMHCTRRLSHCTHLTYIWGICFLKSSDSGRIENHNGVSGSCINAPVHHNFNAAVAPGATCKSALSDHDCNKWAALLYCEPWSKFRPFMNDKCYAACEFYHMQPW